MRRARRKYNKGHGGRDVGLYVDQQFANIFPFRTDFRLRTCHATRGPADVRHAQLAVRTGLILTNQGTVYVPGAWGSAGNTTGKGK